MEDSTVFQKSDIQLCFMRAAGMLQVDCDFEISLKSYKYLHVSSSYDGKSRLVKVSISSEYQEFDSEIVLGMALQTLSQLFRKKVSGDAALSIVKRYSEFFKSEGAYKLSNVLRSKDYKKRESDPVLAMHRDLLLTQYFQIFSENGSKRDFAKTDEIPSVEWTEEASVRRLGYYDSALNRVVISKNLSSGRIPDFVLQNVLFHELLHAKHDVNFKRKRQRIHSPEFRVDEKKFERFEEAEKWIKYHHI